MPRLSIVVAAKDCHSSLEQCLRSIEGQRGAVDAELVIVAPAGSPEHAVAAGWMDARRARGSAGGGVDPLTDCRVIVASGDVLVPSLWARGIEAARGDWVALTIGQCVPDRGWLVALWDALPNVAVGVGGPITLGAADSATMAAYLLRYTPYLPPFDRRIVPDIPGDNAVYRREALLGEEWPDGFWENEVHVTLRRRGHALVLDPRPSVALVTIGSARAFCRQRFRHGRRFGAWRAGFRPSPGRALLAPVVPFLYLARIVARVARRPERQFVPRALPFLIGYLVCWTAGEALGAMTGR